MAECGICGEPAAFDCQECGDKLCSDCNSEIHSGELAHHKSRPLGGGSAGASTSTPASIDPTPPPQVPAPSPPQLSAVAEDEEEEPDQSLTATQNTKGKETTVLTPPSTESTHSPLPTSTLPTIGTTDLSVDSTSLSSDPPVPTTSTPVSENPVNNTMNGVHQQRSSISSSPSSSTQFASPSRLLGQPQPINEVTLSAPNSTSFPSTHLPSPSISHPSTDLSSTLLRDSLPMTPGRSSTSLASQSALPASSLPLSSSSSSASIQTFQNPTSSLAPSSQIQENTGFAPSGSTSLSSASTTSPSSTSLSTSTSITNNLDLKNIGKGSIGDEGIDGGDEDQWYKHHPLLRSSTSVSSVAATVDDVEVLRRMILRLESEKVDLMGEKSRLQGDMAMLKHEVELMQIATQGRSSSNGTSNGNGATGGVTTSNINSEMGRVQRDMAMELEMVRLKDLITEQALQIDKLMRQVEIKTKENASLVQSEAEGRKAMGMAMGDAESQMKTLELEKRGFLERIRLLEESTTEAIQEKKKAQGKLIHTSANLEALTAAHARLQHHYYRLQTNALRGGVVVPGLPVLHEKDLSPIPPASSSSPSSSSPSTTSSFSQQSHPSHNYEGNHMTSEEATFMLALSPLDQAKTRDELLSEIVHLRKSLVGKDASFRRLVRYKDKQYQLYDQQRKLDHIVALVGALSLAESTASTSTSSSSSTSSTMSSSVPDHLVDSLGMKVPNLSILDGSSSKHGHGTTNPNKADNTMTYHRRLAELESFYQRRLEDASQRTQSLMADLVAVTVASTQHLQQQCRFLKQLLLQLPPRIVATLAPEVADFQMMMAVSKRFDDASTGDDSSSTLVTTSSTGSLRNDESIPDYTTSVSSKLPPPVPSIPDPQPPASRISITDHYSRGRGGGGGGGGRKDMNIPTPLRDNEEMEVSPLIPGSNTRQQGEGRTSDISRYPKPDRTGQVPTTGSREPSGGPGHIRYERGRSLSTHFTQGRMDADIASPRFDMWLAQASSMARRSTTRSSGGRGGLVKGEDNHGDHGMYGSSSSYHYNMTRPSRGLPEETNPGIVRDSGRRTGYREGKSMENRDNASRRADGFARSRQQQHETERGRLGDNSEADDDDDSDGDCDPSRGRDMIVEGAREQERVWQANKRNSSSGLRQRQDMGEDMRLRQTRQRPIMTSEADNPNRPEDGGVDDPKGRTPMRSKTMKSALTSTLTHSLPRHLPSHSDHTRRSAGSSSGSHVMENGGSVGSGNSGHNSVVMQGREYYADSGMRYGLHPSVLAAANTGYINNGSSR